MYQNDKSNISYRRYASIWERYGCKLVRFTLGATKERKIIATSGFIKSTDAMPDPKDWFGVAPCGNIGIIDVDMHSENRGFELLDRLEGHLGMAKGFLKEMGYCYTPGGGLHICVEFPDRMLDGRMLNKKIFGNEHPELEFFHGEKFKCILPGAHRYDGVYKMTDYGVGMFEKHEDLARIKLNPKQGADFIALLAVSGKGESKGMPDYTDMANWQRGQRHDMFKYWSIRLYDPSTAEEFKVLIENAKSSGLSDKQIHSMSEFARRVRMEADAANFLDSVVPKRTIFITNAQYNDLGGNDGSLFFHLLNERFHINIRKNVRSGYNEMKFKSTGDSTGDDFRDWVPYTDAVSDKLATIIKDWVRVAYRTDADGESQYSTFKSIGWIEKYMNLAEFEEKVDPFKLWLERLPAWDRVTRLDSFLGECFDIDMNDDRTFAEFTLRSTLIAAISRAYHPGYKHDTMSVLVGPQGCGKSTFWRELIPYHEWFSDSINLASDDKARVESLLGRVIIECSEMHGSTRAEVEALKAFISRQRDKLRMAYARYVSEHERRCVIVGSTNSETCLPNDPTGNRRFIVAEVRPHNERTRDQMKALLDELRDQIWAEALHRYVEGERGYIPKEYEELQVSINRRFTPCDELMEIRVTRAVTELQKRYFGAERNEVGFTMDEVYRAINDFSEDTELKASRSEQRIIGGMLKNTHGWTSRQRKHDGIRAMRWDPPKIKEPVKFDF